MSLLAEQPTLVGCSGGQVAICNDAGKDTCKSKDNNLYVNCLADAKAACMAACNK